MWNIVSKLLFRGLSVAVAVPVGRAITKLIENAWTAARPDHPPHDPSRADTRWTDAITWAIISGVGVALGRLVTTKGAVGAWKAIVGTPPPGYDTDPEPPAVSTA